VLKKLFSVFMMGAAMAGTAYAADGIVVKTARGFATDFEVKVSDVNLGKSDVLGRKAVTVSIPNGQQMLEKDAPQLPYYTALVMVDPLREPVLRAHSIQSEITELDAPVVPSKGNFTRNIDPNSVPYKFGEVYNQDRWYPADEELVQIQKPFLFRNIRGTRLAVFPVQYNPVKNKLRIHRSIKVTVGSGAPDSGNVVRAPLGISRYFESVYANSFVNFKQVASRLPRLDENGRLLIITADEFAGALDPFVAWKMKTGLKVQVAKMSEVGKTNIDVKNFIQAEYDKGGLTNIMLVGDADKIPTNKGVKENADSDPCYVKLAGDDHVPDAIISRLSAANETEVAYQVAKFINYERFPTTDKAWYTKGVGVASAEGTPKDFEYMEQNRGVLMGKMFTAIDKVYDPGATIAMVSDALNQGRSLLNYLGHGSGTSWGTTRFSNANIAALKNGWKMPIIWDVACLNGRFVNTTGFGEAWLRAGNIDSPAGAVGYAGSTTNMEWVPPIHVQAEFNKNYIANEVYKTVGGIFINGVMKGLELYGTDPKKSGVMMFEQWHIFGDGTLLVRFKAPEAVTANVEAAGNKVAVKVVDANGKAVESARVTVYSERYEVIKTGRTDATGVATILVDAQKGMDGFVTVVGSNLVPVVDQKFTF
jgi:gingipain R